LKIDEISEDNTDVESTGIHVGEVIIFGNLIELPRNESVRTSMESKFIKTVYSHVLLSIPMHCIHSPEELYKYNSSLIYL
jgi:putative aminopeptidase FrvX